MKTCSVIVPIYNAEPFLAKCLCSLIHQSYSDLQIILVDDGCTDKSHAIALAFAEADNRIKLISISHQGQSVARNQGIKIATGEYIIFLDADDWLDLDYIQRHIDALQDADYVQSGYRRVSIDGKILQQKLPCHKYQFTSPCMRLYRRQAIADMVFQNGMIYEDVIFSLQLWGQHLTCNMLKYIGYNYMFNPYSTTATKHSDAQTLLYKNIFQVQAPWWLKIYTRMRLTIHFLCS